MTDAQIQDEAEYQAFKKRITDAIEVIQEVADEAIGTRTVPLPDGTTYDLDGEWATIQMYPSLSEALGEWSSELETVDLRDARELLSNFC